MSVPYCHIPLRAALTTNPQRPELVKKQMKKNSRTKRSGKKKKKKKKKVRKRKRKRNRLCFGLRSEVSFLLPITAVYRSSLCIHDAPPGADHLEREIACGGSDSGTAATAAALRCPPPTIVAPGPEGAWEKRKGDDAFVLVASEELALDSAAFDVLFEPCDRFVVVGLRQMTEMRSLLSESNSSGQRSIAHNREHKVISFCFCTDGIGKLE
jgi:hypothetical protein